MSIPAIGFSAYSGTGKTTLIEKLIPELKTRGLRIAVIKHDAHHFEIDREGKDSWRFAQAGADTVILSSAQQTAIIEKRSHSLEELLCRIRDADLVLVEGYRDADIPRIGVCRAATGAGFMDDISHFAAIVTDVPVSDSPVPCFGLEEIKEIADFICNKIMKR